MSRPSIAALDPADFAAAIPGLAALLVDAVESGASVNFLAGLTLAEASAWWSSRSPLVEDGMISVVVAREPGASSASGGRVVGSAMLVRSRNPNSPHRAEVQKVLVHSTARRRGLGRALMDAIEALARADGRWLLLLDTQAGTAAETFYRSLGWHELGVVPDHSLRVDGTLAPTVFFWKDLRESAPV